MGKTMNKRKIVVGILSLLIIILCVLGVYSVIKFSTNKKYENLKVTDSEVQKLFLLTRKSMDAPLFFGTNYENIYYKNDNVIMSEVDQDLKMILAFETLDNDNMYILEGANTFDANVLKDQYVSIFGSDADYQDHTFKYSCPNEIVYNQNANIYQVSQICSFIYDTSYENKIVEARRYDDRIEIFEKVIFYTYEDGKKVYYNDIDLTDKYVKDSVNFDKDKLNKYKYTFKKADDGKYYFESVQKQK